MSVSDSLQKIVVLCVAGVISVTSVAFLVIYYGGDKVEQDIINAERDATITNTNITQTTQTTMIDSNLLLTSSAFSNGEKIPSKYTCDGENISPPLAIGGVPNEAQSIVLIMDDPDAPVGVWDHWIVFNIDPSTNDIVEGSEPKGVGGTNSWEKTGYGGPCPGSGEHRYFFKLYALDTILKLERGSTKQELESTMEGHILEQTELVGIYERSR